MHFHNKGCGFNSLYLTPTLPTYLHALTRCLLSAAPTLRNTLASLPSWALVYLILSHLASSRCFVHWPHAGPARHPQKNNTRARTCEVKPSRWSRTPHWSRWLTRYIEHLSHWRQFKRIPQRRRHALAVLFMKRGEEEAVGNGRLQLTRSIMSIRGVEAVFVFTFKFLSSNPWNMIARTRSSAPEHSMKNAPLEHLSFVQSKSSLLQWLVYSRPSCAQGCTQY